MNSRRRLLAAVLAAAAVAAAVGLMHGEVMQDAGGRAAAGGVAGVGEAPRAQPLPLPAAPDPLDGTQLRYRLEAALLDGAEVRTPGELESLLPSLAARHFAPGEQVRALAWLQRYVGYRVALGKIPAPRDPANADALRQAMTARQRVREQHFDAAERDLLFAAEEALDRYTLARLAVVQHPVWSDEQKAAALRQAEQELEPAQRAARREATLHLEVARESARFDAERLGDIQRHAQRRERYGEAAAWQLAQLDREEAQWQERLTRYASAAASAAPDTLQTLRDQLFSPAEQLRLDGALALRALSLPADKP